VGDYVLGIRTILLVLAYGEPWYLLNDTVNRNLISKLMNESHGRSHASLHCTTFRRPAYQMANWPLNTDVVQVHPWMQGRPSDVNGFTNAAMAWMPKSGHGADGRLANHHDSPV